MSSSPGTSSRCTVSYPSWWDRSDGTGSESDSWGTTPSSWTYCCGSDSSRGTGTGSTPLTPSRSTRGGLSPTDDRKVPSTPRQIVPEEMGDGRGTHTRGTEVEKLVQDLSQRPGFHWVREEPVETKKYGGRGLGGDVGGRRRRPNKSPTCPRLTRGVDKRTN